ncbi:MAG: PEP-CTERM sorting domain-containing protein [Planctomycetaceae bacterium]|nr:PEP-CTERM sorting domain-containing protein [Planctomycetaceae bacterium]
MRQPLATVLTLVALTWLGGLPRAGAFDLQFSIGNPGNQFDANELNILYAALVRVERLWETVITGYQPNINVPSVPIEIRPTTGGLAAANFLTTSVQGGFTLATSGFVDINVNEIENFANWQGVGANGRNYIDELLAHEVGHVLGVGTLWISNGNYVSNTFQYTGVHGTAAYQTEFNQATPFIPVENAGNPGTQNAHWDQLMRSSVQEGNPNDPFSLSPLVGVTDQYGRDRGLELMTGAIDPDFGEPFISRFTVQSMRDMGYTVAEFEDSNGDGLVDAADVSILKANYGATGLEIDSMAFGDANRDRRVDGADFLLWQRAFVAGGGALSVPEPGAALLTLAGMAILSRARRRSR